MGGEEGGGGCGEVEAGGGEGEGLGFEQGCSTGGEVLG